MGDISGELIKHWGGGCVILSPRDVNPDSLERRAQGVRKAGGQCLFDPQFYLPDADHDRLTSYDYWPTDYSTTEFWSGKQVSNLVQAVISYCRRLDCSAVILPSIFGHVVDDTWLKTQELVREIATKSDAGGLPLYATVALSERAMVDQAQIETLMADAETWAVDGVYLVCEHVSSYLVDNATWLSNMLDIIAGFRLRGRAVIVGYCTQQMLIAGCSAATAVASGTWMNVRSFPQDKFREQGQEIARRGTWYYAPQVLTEFKVPLLDLAKRQKLLGLLEPPGSLRNEYSDMLFGDAQPSLSGFGEGEAFRHYLHCLRGQAQNAVAATFDDTIGHHEEQLGKAGRLLERLHKAGFYGQNRDFGGVIDANLAAIATLRATLGPTLRRQWPRLTRPV